MAHARWTYFEVLQALGLLHELLYEQGQIQLVGSGDVVGRSPLLPTLKRRAQGKLARRDEVSLRCRSRSGEPAVSKAHKRF
jgi:hypothetical protein